MSEAEVKTIKGSQGTEFAEIFYVKQPLNSFERFSVSDLKDYSEIVSGYYVVKARQNSSNKNREYNGAVLETGSRIRIWKIEKDGRKSESFENRIFNIDCHTDFNTLNNLICQTLQKCKEKAGKLCIEASDLLSRSQHRKKEIYCMSDEEKILQRVLTKLGISSESIEQFGGEIHPIGAAKWEDKTFTAIQKYIIAKELRKVAF